MCKNSHHSGEPGKQSAYILNRQRFLETRAVTKLSLLQVDLGMIIVMQPKIFIHALIRSPSKSLTPRVQLCPEPATNVQQFMITNALDHVGLSYPILHVFRFSLNPGVADFCSTIRSFQRDFEDRGLPSKMSIQSHS